MREARRAHLPDCRGLVTRSLWAGLCVALFFVLVPVRVGRSQAPGQNIGTPGTWHPYYPPTEPPFESSDGYDTVEAERRLNALNIERQKEMVSDTNKLLKLARELNEEVAASNTATLTFDQIHKIAEIEKLARSVKEKMADGVSRPLPSAEPPLLVPVQ